jgi:hypothetical protein
VQLDYKVAYIISLTHSGSTLLDCLIGAHSQATSTGEAFQLASYAQTSRVQSHKRKLGNQCTCGAPTIWECPFWTEADRWLRDRDGRSLTDLDIDSREPGRFARDNKAFFDAVAAVSQTGLIVDSSKSLDRFRRLRASGTLPLVPIFPIRDPRGQVSSIIKRTSVAEVRPALSYSLNTLRALLALGGNRPITVCYEKLVSDPAGTLATVMEQLGLAFEPGQIKWGDADRHNLGGNAMRAQRSNQIRNDEAWKTALSARQALTVRLIAGPARNLAGWIWDV